MISIPHGNATGPAPSWYQWGQLTMLRCPRGHVASLDHDIAADGAVSPSAVCPGDRMPCDFHEFIRLEGWSAPLAEMEAPND